MVASERPLLTHAVSRCVAVCAAAASVVLVAAAQSPTEADRINALISRMTLEEKLGQLQQLDGEGDGRYRPEHLDLARKGLLGSTLNVRGAAQVNALQRVAIGESRLKIPLIFAFDVIHGYRTIFPIPLGEAASWDPAGADFAMMLGEFYCAKLDAPLLAEVVRDGVVYARVYDLRGRSIPTLLTQPGL